jgi:hypothetical protein
MKAADHLKVVQKRRDQVYGPDRSVIDAVIYLLERLRAEESDIEDQIARQAMADEFTDCGRPAGSPYEGQD